MKVLAQLVMVLVLAGTLSAGRVTQLRSVGVPPGTTVYVVDEGGEVLYKAVMLEDKPLRVDPRGTRKR